MTKKRIIFRADGDAKIGLGHVSRCLALAELLADEYSISFAIQVPGQHIVDSISKLALELITLPSSHAGSLAFITELDPHLTGDEIIVIDGYHFDTTYEQRLKSKVGAVVSIDDLCNRHFVSDAVFNFCGAFRTQDYSREYYTQLFLGLKYVFLRSPFLMNTPLTDKKFSSRLFLNMGGADLGNETLKILTELDSMNYPGAIEVTVGGSYPHLNSLESITKSRKSIRLHQGLTAEEMFASMRRCAIAITPPSTVALEFLSTGGLAYLYQTADNQAYQRAYLLDSNLAYEYSTSKLMDVREQKSLFDKAIQNQKEIFDGSSKARVKTVFKQVRLSSQLVLRNATTRDMEQCFQWANDPEVRRYSYTTEPILWEGHCQWFEKKLADPSCFYFMAEIDGQLIGQIRFDFLKDDNAYQISYTLDKNCRGKGLGYYLLVKGVQALGRITTFEKIIGYVQSSNVASIKAFQKASFTSHISDNYPDSFKFELFKGI